MRAAFGNEQEMERTSCNNGNDEPSENGCDRSEASTSLSSHSVSELYIKHKVSKLDTLAGLAVKYNVSVADVKRANGLLSDTAMFAKDTLLIPTQPFNIGEDMQLLAAKIMSGYGRDPALHIQSRKTPGSAAAMRFSGSPRVRASSQDDGDDPGTPYSKRSETTDPGDVELTEFGIAGDAPNKPHDAWGQQITRRRGTKDGGNDSEWRSDDRSAGRQWSSLAPQPMLSTTGKQDAQHRKPGELGGAWQQVTQLSKSIGASQLIQKIKKVASQPALANAQYKSFADAADAVLTSTYQTKRKGSASSTSNGTPPLSVLPSRVKNIAKRE